MTETGFEKTVEVVVIAKPYMRSGFKQCRIAARTKAPQQEKFALLEIVTPEETYFRVKRFGDFREVKPR